MAKGLVAVLLFGAVMFCLLLPTLWHNGLLRTCRDWLDSRGILIFLAIAAPWHIAASLVEPIFPWFYFINEHVLRFLGTREPHDYYAGAWWYYLPRMAIYMFPWSFLLPCLLQPRQHPQREKDTKNLSFFLLLAWMIPLVFFSVSSAKANYYLIAVMPFAVFQLALAIENRGFLQPALRALPGVLIAALAAALYVVLTLRGDHVAANPAILGATPAQFASEILIDLVVAALLCAIVAWRWARAGILTYLAISAGCACAMIVTVRAIEPQVSTRPLAQYLRTQLGGRAVYLYRNFEEQSSLPFYMERPIPIIDSRSNDLFWGNKLQPNDLMITSEQLEQVLPNRPVAIVVMQRQRKDFEAGNLFAHMKGKQQVGATTVFFN